MQQRSSGFRKSGAGFSSYLGNRCGGDFRKNAVEEILKENPQIYRNSNATDEVGEAHSISARASSGSSGSHLGARRLVPQSCLAPNPFLGMRIPLPEPVLAKLDMTIQSLAAANDLPKCSHVYGLKMDSTRNVVWLPSAVWWRWQSGATVESTTACSRTGRCLSIQKSRYGAAISNNQIRQQICNSIGQTRTITQERR